LKEKRRERERERERGGGGGRKGEREREREGGEGIISVKRAHVKVICSKVVIQSTYSNIFNHALRINVK